jgi:nicotinamidase-related amidase
MDGAAAVAKIAKLVDLFHERGWLVVFTTNAYVSLDEASVFREKLPILNQLTVDGPLAPIDPRLNTGSSDFIFRKIVPSAFFDSPLREKLRQEGIDSTVLCGFSTSGCVRASAVDALQSNFRVTVVEDACGDRDPLAHDYNLRDLRLKTGDVVKTDDFIHKLRQH